MASASKDESFHESKRTKLNGDIEFDESYVGGVELGVGGRSRGKKTPVAVACAALVQRRSEQAIVDETHATMVRERRNGNKAKKRRKIRCVEAQEQGRSGASVSPDDPRQ